MSKASIQRSNTMRAVKSSGSKLEVNFGKKLYSLGFRYRKNNRNLYGIPDYSNQSKKIVIFLDSCFWHGCIKHCRMPNTNKKYWDKKIKRNIKRDIEVNRYYKQKNWNIIRIWEHDLKDIDKVVNKVLKSINNQ